MSGMTGKCSPQLSESHETVQVSEDNITDCERSQSQLNDRSVEQLLHAHDHGE